MVEYVVAGIAVAIAGHYLKKAQPKISGWRGEVKLAKKAKRLKLRGKIKVMRDCLFRKEKGGTSQTDVLAVTRRGIIFFENKNHKCDVFGAETDEYWLCKYPPHPKKRDIIDSATGVKHQYRFIKDLYNPIKQNRSHIGTVAAILRDKYPNVPFYSLVVFNDAANLHVQNSRDKVCNLKQLNKVVSRIVGEEVLTDKEVADIAKILDRAQIKGRAARKAHVVSIEANKEFYKNHTYEDLDRYAEAIKEYADLQSKETQDAHDAGKESAVPSDFHSRPLSEIIQIAHDRVEAPQDAQPSKPFTR